MFIALAFLLFVGIANATGIPESVDPQNYPVVWTETVYNGSGAAIQSARIVVWDYDTSDSSVNEYDNMCPWIKIAAATDDPWTAGVTIYGQSIADKTAGQIIIKGPTVIEKGASATVNQCVGSTASTGKTVDFGASADECTVGKVIIATDENSPGKGYATVHVEVFCGD
jgi:hypothetical protein